MLLGRARASSGRGQVRPACYLQECLKCVQPPALWSCGEITAARRTVSSWMTSSFRPRRAVAGPLGLRGSHSSGRMSD
eukprot:9471611-Pyramimonas_sp.AAC.1